MNALLHAIARALVAYGPWGVFVLGVVDSLGIPLPAAMDVLLIGIGAGSVKMPYHAYFAALMAVLGSMGGNLGLFMAARGGARWLSRSEPPPGKSQRLRQWCSRYGLVTVFVAALTPVPPLPLKVFVVSAGALRASFARFLAVIVVARVLRYFGEAWLGLTLGKDAPGFLARNGWTLAGAALGLAIALYLVMRLMENRRQPAL
ncbi:MAG: VTT domain-containing protein [Bryobacteraceae bacterium]|jgi:membrane protein YqaA with SNARE-associated domain